MENKNLSKNNTDELLEGQKRVNSNTIYNAILIGFLIGIVIYSTVKHGLGFFTFFPLFFVYLLIKKRKKIKTDINNLLCLIVSCS